MGKITYTVNGIFPGRKLRGKERYAKLYHYTSFDSFVRIWLEKSLRFSSIRHVNDVLERVVPEVASIYQIALLEAYVDIRPQFKQISLTMDYDSYMRGCMSPCMWGYYADKKRGVCIELDYNNLPFSKSMIKGPVVYKKYIPSATCLPPDVVTENQLLAFIRKNARSEFLTKHVSWKGENEYRIISREDEVLDIRKAISAVYLTSYDSDECLLVEELVNKSVPVNYLHYISQSGTGYAIPVVSDANSHRQEHKRAMNNPDNDSVKIQNQARSLYEQHRNEPDYPLLMQTI